MTRLLRILVATVALAAAGSALAATPSWISVSPASTTAGVATLELVDPVHWSGRSVPARNGVYFGFCDRGPLRPCALGWGAFTARRQAFSLALTTFRDTNADVVVVGLPQSRSHFAVLVFERDMLSSPELDPLAATAARVYAMGGLVAHSETEDSLVLVKLRPSPAARWGR